MDILQELKKEMDYKWKPQSQNKDKTKWQCVAYIDARDVQDRLDEVCGTDWQVEYYETKWKLFARIGIKINNEWVWRWDSGFLENEHIEEWTESKWEVSDTFKRSAVAWGVGRFLYSKKIVWITREEYNANKYELTDYINNRKSWSYTPKAEKPKEPVKPKEKKVFTEEIYTAFITKNSVWNIPKDKYETYEKAIAQIESIYDIDNHYKEQIKLLYTNF